MIGGLILLSIVLTALVGALCIHLYKQQNESLAQSHVQKQMLARLDVKLQELSVQQLAVQKRIDQLAADVLHREIYQNADDRHQLAIKSAKQGKSLFELIQRHGLSTDEAALILSLHAPKHSTAASSVKNANLTDPTALDVI